MSDDQMLTYLAYAHASYAGVNQMVGSFHIEILGEHVYFVQIPGLYDPEFLVYHGRFEGFVIVLLYRISKNWLTAESHDVVILTDCTLWKPNYYEGKVNPPKCAVFRYHVSKDELSQKLTTIFAPWVDKQTYAEVYQRTGKAVNTIDCMRSWYIADFWIKTARFQDGSGWIFVIEGWDYLDRTVYPMDIEPSRALLLEWLDKIITDME